MATPVSDKAAVDIPARVFEKYLQALVDAKASPEVISPLACNAAGRQELH
jgi:hypothetical protein